MLLALGGAACASAPRNQTGPDVPGATPAQSTPAGPPEIYGPVAAQGSPAPAAPQETYGPAPVQARAIVLVLGPGMARGYAHAGVLKALHDEKIPVAAVLGTEMGALIGTLYAESANVNAFEWAMLRFKEDVFSFESGGLLSRLRRHSAGAEGKKLNEALKSALLGKTLSDAKIPLRVGVQMQSSGSTEYLSRGSASASVRAALAVKGLLSPGSLVQSEDAASAVASRPYPISEARALGLGPVVVVDLLENDLPAVGNSDDDARSAVAIAQLQAAQRLGAAELKEADLVIRPEMNGISAMDYPKRTESMFRGKRSVKDHLEELKRLISGAASGSPR